MRKEEVATVYLAEVWFDSARYPAASRRVEPMARNSPTEARWANCRATEERRAYRRAEVRWADCRAEEGWAYRRATEERWAYRRAEARRADCRAEERWAYRRVTERWVDCRRTERWGDRLTTEERWAYRLSAEERWAEAYWAYWADRRLADQMTEVEVNSEEVGLKARRELPASVILEEMVVVVQVNSTVDVQEAVQASLVNWASPA